MRLTGILSLVFCTALAASAQAQVPAGYPADYKTIVDGAKKEGKVVVYSTTDAKLVGALIKDFEAAFPGVKVEYTDLNSTEVYNRFISENAANAASADAVWSSSMDLQMKLAADGAAMVYKSPEVDGAARMGALQGHGLRDDVRADRHRLQQAAGAGRRGAEDARRPGQAVDDQGREVSEQGHRVRPGKVGRGLHARQSGRQARSASSGTWSRCSARAA